MADIGSLLLASFDALEDKVVEDAVFNRYPLYAMMGDGSPVDGGNQIEKIVRIGKNFSVQARDYREDIPFGENDPLVTALWPWKFINGSVAWWDAQEKMNSGKAQKIDFVKSLNETLIDSMTEGVALEQWQNGAGKHFDGIAAIIDNDNIYGGIDRSLAVNAPWRAICGTGYDTSESISIRGGTDGGVQHLVYKCSGNGGYDSPDYAVTTLAIFEKLIAHYDAKTIQRNAKMAEMGFPANFMIGGLTVFYDENAPAGSFEVLNTKHLQMKPHVSNAKKFSMTAPENRYSNGQKGKVVLVEYMGNMICKNPRRCGALTNKS